MNVRGIQAFETIFPLTPVIDVLDVGSNPNERQAAPPAYAGLLARGRCRVTGFEPGAQAFAELQKIKGENERYFPYAIGDGTTQTFYECAMGVMSSLYPPNHELLKDFHLLGEAAQVVKHYPVETKRLDDIPEITTCDYIQMDVQGAELQCLQGAQRVLKNVSVVQAETLFLPMYINQPLFSEVEIYMRSQGFMLHRIESVQKRTWKPLMVNRDPLQGWQQWFWGDAIFVRDFTQWKKMSADALLKMVCILHDIYHAFDLAQLILAARDETHGTRDAGVYYQVLCKDVPELTFRPAT